jgi:hypothetical protein
VLRISDAARLAMGQEWLPLVESWGSIEDAIAQVGSGGTIATFDITVLNTVRIDTPDGITATRFSDLIRAGLNAGANTFDLAFADAKLYMIFEGAVGAADAIVPCRLKGEEVTNLTPDTCVLHMSGIELALEDLDPLYRVGDEFGGADPDIIDQPIPWAFGPLRDVPGMGLVAGLVHVLASDITADDPPTGGTLRVSDRELLARMPDAGTLQDDDEQITHTGKNLDAIGFTGITRGANGTDPASHNKASRVYQVLSEYVYAFADQPGLHRNRGNLRAKSDGAVVDPATYTVELANTTLLPGRVLTLAKFTVLPVIKRQVVIVANDQIVVDDTIAVDDQIGVAEDIGVVDSIGISTQGREAVPLAPLSATPVTLRAAPNPNGVGPGGYTYQSTVITLEPLPAGAPTERVLWEVGLETFSGDFGQNLNVVGSQGWNLIATVRVAGVTVTVFELRWVNGATLAAFFNGAPMLQFATPEYGTEMVLTLGVGVTPDLNLAVNAGVRAGYVSVSKVSAMVKRPLTVEKAGTVTKSGTAAKTGQASKAGAAVKLGTVTIEGNSSAETVLGRITADLDGLQDDDAGAVSQVAPNLFLEVPADPIKLLMREYYGENVNGNYDLVTWFATRGKQAAAGLKWAFLWRGMPWSEFRRLAGLQSRSDLFQDGGKWLHVYREISAPVMTFDTRNTIGRPVGGQTPRTELVTAISAPYDWDDVESRWRGSIRRVSARGQERYGARRRLDKKRGVKDLPLPWIRDPATADAIATYWLGQLEKQRLTVTIRGTWEALVLDKADPITVDTAAYPHLAPFGQIGYTVRDKRYLLHERLVEITAVELDFLPSEIILPAEYRLLRTATRTLAAAYRLGFTRDKNLSATYRVKLAGLEVALAALYRLRLIGTPTLAAEYRLLPTLEVALPAAYSIATRWDSGLRWDQPGIYWDGAAAPPLLAWDYPTAAAPAYRWDQAGLRWDN